MTTTATRKTTTMIDELLELDAQLEALAEQRTAVADKLIAFLDTVEGKSVETDAAQVTVVRQTNVIPPEFDVIRKLHPTWARRVTKVSLDAAKFKLLRKAEQLPADIEALTTERESNPFLRITLR